MEVKLNGRKLTMQLLIKVTNLMVTKYKLAPPPPKEKIIPHISAVIKYGYCSLCVACLPTVLFQIIIIKMADIFQRRWCHPIFLFETHPCSYNLTYSAWMWWCHALPNQTVDRLLRLHHAKVHSSSTSEAPNCVFSNAPALNLMTEVQSLYPEKSVTVVNNQ